MNVSTQPSSQPQTAPSGHALAQAIGASLAEPLARMRKVVDQVHADGGRLSADQLLLLRHALDQAQAISRQSQQLARLASGKLRQSHEQLALHEMVVDVLLQHQPAWRARGIDVRQHLSPVDVVVDPGLLSALLDATLAWALGLGPRLLVMLEMKIWPEHGELTFRVERDAPSATDEAVDNLDWQLVLHNAHAMDVTVKREVAADHVEARLVFLRTVRHLSGITAMDVERDLGPDTWQVSSSLQLAGLSVMLVSSDVKLHRTVKAMCADLDMDLRLATGVRQAQEACEQHFPSLLLVDEEVRDGALDQLLARLQREKPRMRVVEIASQDTDFQIASWEQTSRSRISREAVKDQLVALFGW